MFALCRYDVGLCDVMAYRHLPAMPMPQSGTGFLAFLCFCYTLLSLWTGAHWHIISQTANYVVYVVYTTSWLCSFCSLDMWKFSHVYLAHVNGHVITLPNHVAWKPAECWRQTRWWKSPRSCIFFVPSLPELLVTRFQLKKIFCEYSPPVGLCPATEVS